LRSTGDVAEDLVSLVDDIVRDGHRLAVVAGGAGDPDIIALDDDDDDGVRLADLGLEATTGRDMDRKRPHARMSRQSYIEGAARA
jgi:hypothetical protein